MEAEAGKRLARALLEELAAVASDDSSDPAWVRGYVAGIENAAKIALELEDEAD